MCPTAHGSHAVAGYLPTPPTHPIVANARGPLAPAAMTSKASHPRASTAAARVLPGPGPAPSPLAGRSSSSQVDGAAHAMAKQPSSAPPDKVNLRPCLSLQRLPNGPRHAASQEGELISRGSERPPCERMPLVITSCTSSGAQHRKVCQGWTAQTCVLGSSVRQQWCGRRRGFPWPSPPGENSPLPAHFHAHLAILQFSWPADRDSPSPWCGTAALSSIALYKTTCIAVLNSRHWFCHKCLLAPARPL